MIYWAAVATICATDDGTPNKSASETIRISVVEPPLLRPAIGPLRGAGGPLTSRQAARITAVHVAAVAAAVHKEHRPAHPAGDLEELRRFSARRFTGPT